MFRDVLVTKGLALLREPWSYPLSSVRLVVLIVVAVGCAQELEGGGTLLKVLAPPPDFAW